MKWFYRKIYHFHYPDKATHERLCWIERKLVSLMENIMSSFDDLKAAQADTDAKVGAVKADIESLIAKLAAVPAAGMTADQQAALDDAVAHAKAINASLAVVDAEANPAPAPVADPAAPAQ